MLAYHCHEAGRAVVGVASLCDVLCRMNKSCKDYDAYGIQLLHYVVPWFQAEVDEPSVYIFQNKCELQTKIYILEKRQRRSCEPTVGRVPRFEQFSATLRALMRGLMTDDGPVICTTVNANCLKSILCNLVPNWILCQRLRDSRASHRRQRIFH